jgi:hypothetical protein
MKRMTSHYPFACQKKTPDDAMFLNRFICVSGTGWIIPATGGKMGRKNLLIKPY